MNVDMVDTLDILNIINMMNIAELFVGKHFQSWNHVANFMKKYSAFKGHGVWIGSGSKIDKATNEVIKWTYLYQHAEKVKFNWKLLNHSNASSCQVKCSWKVNIWIKKSKNCLKVTTFNNQHVGYELHMLANWFDLILQKLLEEIIEEIWFLTVVAKANATIQYRIIQKKYKTRIYW